MSDLVQDHQPCVSIVVPVYNRPQALRRALRSAVAQTMGDVEIIVVDDASEHALRAVDGGVDDPRVHITRRHVNGGVAAAQNTGLGQALGRYIGFLHSDDVWSPDKLEVQVRTLEALPNVAAVESATERANGPTSTIVAPRLTGIDHASLLRRDVRNLHITGLLFRREALESIGGFDQDLRAYEDFDVLTRLTESHAIATTNDVVATIHQDGDDRLGESPWMTLARRQLLDKYDGELRRTFGRLPAVWRDWSFRDALLLMEEGRLREARRRLRSSVSGDIGSAVRRSPVLAASFAGRATAGNAARLYRRRAGLPDHDLAALRSLPSSAATTGVSPASDGRDPGDLSSG